MKEKIALAIALVLIVALLFGRKQLHAIIVGLPNMTSCLFLKPVEDVVARKGNESHKRLASVFRSQALEYPPDNFALLAFKDSGQLQLYVSSGGHPYQFVRFYNLKSPTKDDTELADGIYRITVLEPKSPWHLALKLEPLDILHKLSNLSGQFIHGGEVSAGCLAVSDDDIQDLFILAYDVKNRTIPVIVAPTDYRASPSTSNSNSDIESKIKTSLATFGPPVNKPHSKQ